jgi:hypothetical protein
MWKLKLDAIWICLDFKKIISARLWEIGVNKIYLLQPSIFFDYVMPSIIVVSVVSKSTMQDENISSQCHDGAGAFLGLPSN